MTNRERLHREADNCHYFILCQLADDAEEAGEPGLALGYRWLADHGKWPSMTRGNAYRWHSSGERGLQSSSNLYGVAAPGKHFRRESQALEAAARAIVVDGVVAYKRKYAEEYYAELRQKLTQLREGVGTGKA